MCCHEFDAEKGREIVTDMHLPSVVICPHHTQWMEADVMTDKLLLRPNEVAEALSVSRSKAYELIANKTLPSIELGGCIRVPADLLREWIAAEVRKLHGGPIT